MSHESFHSLSSSPQAEVNAIYDRGSEDDADDAETSRRLFHEEEEEIGCEVFSAVSDDDGFVENSSFTNNEQEHSKWRLVMRPLST